MVKGHQKFELLSKTIIERVIGQPPFQLKAEMPNDACFLYSLKGSNIVYSADTRFKMEQKDAIVLKCGTYFQKWLSNQQNEYEAIAVHFYPEVLKLVYEDKIPNFLKSDSSTNTTTIQKVVSDQLIHNYIEGLLFYFENPALVDDSIVQLKVKEIILLLTKTKQGEQIKELLRDMFNPHEYTFKEVIDKHLLSDLSVDELAELTHLSTSSFKRKFKEIYNDTPAKYIKNKKLESAADLLKVSNKRITDIAFECGFNDVAHFTKSFTETYNQTPSEYRK